jgi:hypothetical protein
MDKRFRNISFTTENMEDFINKHNNQIKLLPIYLDRIRNNEELTEKMLEDIDNFDNNSKMKIILEYNRCMKILVETFKINKN